MRVSSNCHRRCCPDGSRSVAVVGSPAASRRSRCSSAQRPTHHRRSVRSSGALVTLLLALTSSGWLRTGQRDTAWTAAQRVLADRRAADPACSTWPAARRHPPDVLGVVRHDRQLPGTRAVIVEYVGYLQQAATAVATASSRQTNPHARNGDARTLGAAAPGRPAGMRSCAGCLCRLHQAGVVYRGDGGGRGHRLDSAVAE